MLVNYEDLSSVKKAVEVEIPADRISTEAQRVTTEFSRHAKLPGFRPGKVPANVVRTRFAKEIQEEAMRRLLPLGFRGRGHHHIGRRSRSGNALRSRACRRRDSAIRAARCAARKKERPERFVRQDVRRRRVE